MEPKSIILREQSCIISHNFSCRRPQCSAVSWDLLWLKPRINHSEKVKVAAERGTAAVTCVLCGADTRTRGEAGSFAARREITQAGPGVWGGPSDGAAWRGH